MKKKLGGGGWGEEEKQILGISYQTGYYKFLIAVRQKQKNKQTNKQK